MRRDPNRTTILTLALAGVALAASAARAQPTAAELAEQVQAMAIEAGITADDDELREAAALAERGLTLHPGDAFLQHYRGYALYRLASRHGCDETAHPGCIDRLLDQAEASLEASLAAGPLAETYALLASVHGLRIGEDPARAPALSRRIDDLHAKALALDGENPRVWLLKGIGSFFTPEAYGGGVAPARAELERAAAAFATEAPPPPAPRWGRVDVHAWLGQVLQRAGDREGARAEYQRSLALAPDYAWVRDVLLPGLDEAGS